MANNPKDSKSGDSRSGQPVRGAQSDRKQGANNPSGEMRGQHPGAMHKGDVSQSGQKKDDTRK